MNREIKYNVNHLDLFKSSENIEEQKFLTLDSDEAITILIDDIPVISTGMRVLNDCTGEIWMVKSDYLKKHSLFIIKRLNQLIDFYADKYKLTRIQTVIKPKNEKWIVGLGFEKESELVGFMKDEKIYLYRRLFKWD